MLALPAMAQHADVMCTPATCIMTFTPVKQVVNGCGRYGEIGEFAVSLQAPEGVTWASFRPRSTEITVNAPGFYPELSKTLGFLRHRNAGGWWNMNLYRLGTVRFWPAQHMNGGKFQFQARDFANINANGTGMQVLELTGLKPNTDLAASFALNWSAKFNGALHFMGGKGCTCDTSEIPSEVGCYPRREWHWP